MGRAGGMTKDFPLVQPFPVCKMGFGWFLVYFVGFFLLKNSAGSHFNSLSLAVRKTVSLSMRSKDIKITTKHIVKIQLNTVCNIPCTVKYSIIILKKNQNN